MTPRCVGIEAQASTGWVATDWSEEMVLRLAGTDIYDDWIHGDIEFADPAIADAFEAFRQLALAHGRPALGISGVLRTPIRTSPLGLFDEPPSCVLHRQANFVFGFMPPGLEFGPDGHVHFFALPTIDAGISPPPLLVGSTLAVAFDDRPEVAAVMAYLATPASIQLWAQNGGFLAPSQHRQP